MNKIFEKKVDYANEPEAPMILGMKILKKIEKDWGRYSDVYYEIEDVLIDLGSDNPKRLALALKRVLNNYDMWESPYKGYVNKIEKWTKPTGKVNESRDEEIRKSSFDGLVEKIEYYSNIYKEKGTLSVKQLEDLLRVKNNIIVYGKYGVWWASFAEEILEEHGVKDDYDIEELYKDLYYDRENGFIYESYTPMSDEEYLDKFISICEENDENKITLYFDDVDTYMIERRFGDRFKKYLKMHKDDDINYKAQFVMPNGGYGEEPKCVLTALEYGGYGVSSNYLCDLSFEEFDRLLKNFTHSAGDWHRNDTFMYESYNQNNEGISFNNRDRYDAYVLVDGTGAIIHNYEVWKEDWQSVLNVIIGDANYYAKKNKYGTYYVYGCVNNEYDEDTLVYTTDDIDNIYESNKALNRPLFRRPTHFIKTFKDEVYDILDEMINDGVVDYSDLEDIYMSKDIEDEVVVKIAKMTNYSHSDVTKMSIINFIGEYYNEAYENHLLDIEDDTLEESYMFESDDEDEEEKPKKKNNKTKGRPGKLSGSEYRTKKKEKPQKSGKGKAALAAVAAGGVYTLKKAGGVLVKSFQ